MEFYFYRNNADEVYEITAIDIDITPCGLCASKSAYPRQGASRCLGALAFPAGRPRPGAASPPAPLCAATLLRSRSPQGRIAFLFFLGGAANILLPVVMV